MPQLIEPDPLVQYYNSVQMNNTEDSDDSTSESGSDCSSSESEYVADDDDYESPGTIFCQFVAKKQQIKKPV